MIFSLKTKNCLPKILIASVYRNFIESSVLFSEWLNIFKNPMPRFCPLYIKIESDSARYFKQY